MPSMRLPFRAAIRTCFRRAIRAVPRKALVATLSGLLKPSAPTIPRTFFARPFPFRSCAVSKSLGAHPQPQPGNRRRFQQRSEVAFREATSAFIAKSKIILVQAGGSQAPLRLVAVGAQGHAKN